MSDRLPSLKKVRAMPNRKPKIEGLPPALPKLKYAVKGYRDGSEPPVVVHEMKTLVESNAVAKKLSEDKTLRCIKRIQRVGRKLNKPWTWLYEQHRWVTQDIWSDLNQQAVKYAVNSL